MTIAGQDEVSAGGAVFWRRPQGWSLLLISVRPARYELPKGHVEPGECVEETAVREVREETGLCSGLRVGPTLGCVRYSFHRRRRTVAKTVHFFVLWHDAPDPPRFGPLPSGTRQVRWVCRREIATLRLVSDSLRGVLDHAFHVVDDGAVAAGSALPGTP